MANPLEANDRERLLELLKVEFVEVDHWLKMSLDESNILIPLVEAIKKCSNILDKLALTDRGTTPYTRCWDREHQNLLKENQALKVTSDALRELVLTMENLHQKFDAIYGDRLRVQAAPPTEG